MDPCAGEPRAFAPPVPRLQWGRERVVTSGRAGNFGGCKQKRQLQNLVKAAASSMPPYQNCTYFRETGRAVSMKPPMTRQVLQLPLLEGGQAKQARVDVLQGDIRGLETQL